MTQILCCSLTSSLSALYLFIHVETHIYDVCLCVCYTHSTVHTVYFVCVCVFAVVFCIKEFKNMKANKPQLYNHLAENRNMFVPTSSLCLFDTF